jgi:hypothetical protein
MSLEKVSWKVMSLVLFVPNDCLHPGVVGFTTQNPTRFLLGTDVHDVVRTFRGDLLHRKLSARRRKIRPAFLPVHKCGWSRFRSDRAELDHGYRKGLPKLPLLFGRLLPSVATRLTCPGLLARSGGAHPANGLVGRALSSCYRSHGFRIREVIVALVPT